MKQRDRDRESAKRPHSGTMQQLHRQRMEEYCQGPKKKLEFPEGLLPCHVDKESTLEGEKSQEQATEEKSS